MNGIWRWVVGVLLAVLLSVAAWAWSSVTDQVEQIRHTQLMRAERLARIETILERIEKRVERIEVKLETRR